MIGLAVISIALTGGGCKSPTLAERFEREALAAWNDVEADLAHLQGEYTKTREVSRGQPFDGPAVVVRYAFAGRKTALFESRLVGSTELTSADGYNDSYAFSVVAELGGAFRLRDFDSLSRPGDDDPASLRTALELQHTGRLLAAMQAWHIDLRQLFDPERRRDGFRIWITGTRVSADSSRLWVEMQMQLDNYAGEPPKRAMMLIDSKLNWAVVHWESELYGCRRYVVNVDYQAAPSGGWMPRTIVETFRDNAGEIWQQIDYQFGPPEVSRLTEEDTELEQFGLSETDKPSTWEQLQRLDPVK